MSQILKIQDLKVSFNTEQVNVQAVKEINFELTQGKTLGIVGESGSGKSVTSLAMMQLLPKTGCEVSGHCWFESPSLGKVDLLTLSTEEIQQIRGKEIAMIFQEPMSSLNPLYTCGDQVMEAILLHEKCDKKTAKEKTIKLFEQVELPRPESIFKSYPHQLSGGQKQRVMIAMAISCKPSILIADEPTTALDVTVQKGILKLLEKIQEEYNMSVIFITHDLGVVAEIANEVLVMFKGDVLEKNNVENIFNNAQHPYTKGLLACRPTLETVKTVLPTVEDFLNQEKDSTFVSSSLQKNTTTDKLLLEVKDLCTYFPTKKTWLGKPIEFVKAVNEVNFNVYEGETIGLVGESGCGKTTLGRTILQLIKPTKGNIFFEGKEITNLKSKDLRNLRKDIQIIFQDPYSSLNPKMTIGEIIIEPMRVNNILSNEQERKTKAIELLEIVGLDGAILSRYPHEFSGGQRQRICIARTLALQPKLIICDESVSALDVSVQAKVLNLLNELKSTFHFTYIFISHDLSVVKYMADRMIVMKDGQIVEQGLADEIYQQPQTEYTRSLIEAIPTGDLSKNKNYTHG
ncbi:MAG: ABC transporter ATP-binding protein [Cytophagales bacterium]|nr:ABC transporter ATP-binding protein [Cytophagales bacterium]